MDMQINTVEVKKTLLDYDVTFTSGMVMPVTIDPTAGDTIEFFEKTILISLVAKPSMNDPEKTLPAETVTVFLDHVATIQTREREVVQLNPDQQFEWAKAFQEMTGSKLVQ